MIRSTFPVSLLLAIALAWTASDGHGQEAAADERRPEAPAGDEGLPSPIATLSTWADDVWLDVLDRQGTFHGPLAPEGIFQRFHPQMDPEYSLDLHTGLFTPAEDAAWAHAHEGFRAVGSSISHPHIMNRIDWAQSFEVTGRLDLTADYRRDHSLTDRRDYARVGVGWREAGAEGWSVGARIGVHFLKPAADVEVEASRTWVADADVRWHAGLRVAALEAFSDFVFVGLGVEPDLVEAHLAHSGQPLAVRAMVERHGRRWRAELQAGATTERRAHVTFPLTGSHPFDVSERVWFAGALVEARVAPGLAAAAYGRVADAHWSHAYPFDPVRDLVVSERTGALGAYARWSPGGPWRVDAELQGVWRPEERAGGRETTIEHEDREVYGGLALARRPTRGWTARLAYGALDRAAGVLLPHVSERHHRVVTEAGYRTTAGFDVSAGVRWDLDAFSKIPFDGLLLRMTVLR